MPRNEQREKATSCKTTNVIHSKTKNNTTEEGRKSTENVVTSRTAHNLKHFLPPSKVPTRLESRTSGHLKSTASVIANDNNNKNKCYSNSSKTYSKHPFPSSEDKIDTNVPRKNSCFMKKNSELQNNLMKNLSLSHLRASYPSKSETDEMKFHSRHTIHPKRVLPKKGILKVNSRNDKDLKIRLSEGKISLNPKKKFNETEKTLKPRKVTFKTLSLNDLVKITEENYDLIDVKDESSQECTGDEINKEIDQECTQGEMKKELDHRCTESEKNNELHLECTASEKKKVESIKDKQNNDSTEKQNQLEWVGENDCEREKNLLSIPLQVKADEQMASSENPCEEILQKNCLESSEPEEDSSNEREQSVRLKLDSVVETLENNSPIQEKTEKCIQKLKTEVYLLPTEKASEQSLGKRESIKKQVNEKIRILTAEFLKCIKENNTKIPRSVKHNRGISRKERIEKESQESPNFLPPIQELNQKTTDFKTWNAKNTVSQASITTSNNFQLNTESLAGSREKSILQTDIERCSRSRHNSNQGQGDELTSHGISRIPRPLSSKRESLSLLLPVNLKSGSKTPEDRKRFSAPINRNVVENENILAKTSRYNEQTLSESDKVAMLVKEFDNLQNVSESASCDDGRLEESERSHSRKYYLKKNKSCGKVTNVEKIRNSSNFHGNAEYRNINILKNIIGDSKFNNKQENNTTKFKNRNDKQEEAKGNFCFKPDNKKHSLEGDNVTWPKASYSLKNETPASNCSSEESGSEKAIQYKHKENSEYENSFFRYKKKLCFFILIFLFFTLLFMNFLPVT